LDAVKRKEKIIRENAFEQKKKKPGLKFNPGLALIGLRTTGPPSVSIFFEALSSKASKKINETSLTLLELLW